MSESKIPLAGVIGYPVAHTKSPRIHGAWLRRYGITGHYVPLEVRHDDFAEAIRTLPKLGFVGVNVTIPHKVRALDLADVVSDRAAVIGAANTLTFRADGKIYADNTDGYGFLKNLEQGAPDWQPKAGPALVFGAGGAARAIVAALIDAGVPEVRLANRTRARAEALKAEFGAKIQVYDWVQAKIAVDGAMTVVNTTSLGMNGQPEFRVSLDALSHRATVSDIVYTPLRTGFLTAAANHNCKTVDGLGMLLHQAVPGFERWFGRRPEVDAEIRNVVLNS